MGRIVENQSNEGLGPTGLHLTIGNVPRINGEDAEEIPGYVCSRHELIQLVEHWRAEVLWIGRPSNKILPSSVSLEAAQRAVDWCEFLEAHARKVYATELYPGVQSAHLLKERIEIGEVVDNQSLREIYRHHWTGLKNPAQVKPALGILEEAGWVRVDDVQTDGRPGQVLRLHPNLRDGQTLDQPATRNMRERPRREVP